MDTQKNVSENYNKPAGKFNMPNGDANINPPAEGKITKQIENVTARVPSLGYLALALGSLGASAGLAFVFKKKEWANFVGLWVPTLMLVGVYNKLVKLEGSDQTTKRSANLL